MASVDDKVVSMSFESSKFEQGIDKTINALNKLKEAMKFPDAGKGFAAIGNAAKSTDLSLFGRAIDSIKSKFGALRLVAIGALTHIVNNAIDAGARFVKALTLDPIIAGFHEYETQMGAIQTILSNTQAAGTNLKDVNKALNELNKYADMTIYNFSEMTKNIGTFTAAGVDLKTSVSSIKGIANLAAVSGSNAQQASTAMYQLSQAISAGQVKLQDWNSVVNAGMGGTIFQRALAQTAQHMGTLSKGAVTLTGAMKNVTIHGQSFRQSLASKGPTGESWLTSKVLTTTLKQLSGDMTDAQLAAEGYSKAQIKAIQDQAKMALNAATQVKTLSQLLDTTKEAVGSGWTQTWQIIFGDFGEAKTLFTGLSNAINGFVSTSSNARNKVLKDWKSLGGRTLLIDSLKQAFQDLVAVVKPIKEAFREIFPPVTGKTLLDMTKRFSDFVKALKPGQQTIDNLKRTFAGIFALFDIGKQIIGGIFTVLGDLFGAVAQGRGGFLSFTGTIGDFLVKIDKALKEGGRLHAFFSGLGHIIAAPLALITELTDAISQMFYGFSPGGFSDGIDKATQAMTPFQKIMEGVQKAWDKFIQSFSGADKIMQPVVDAIVKLLQGLGPAINTAVSHMNFEAILAVIRTGLLGGLYLMFKKFLGKGSAMDQISKGFAGGILGNISGSFSALEGSMKALQTNLKAKTLKEIAIAIALLTASVVALSFVDPKKLNTALAAMAIGFGQLIGAVLLLDKYTSGKTAIKLPLLVASLIGLATAIDILSVAVIGLSLLSWEQLIKGLGAVAALLGGLVLVAGPLGKSSSGMIKAGIGITALAVGLNILVIAVAAMGHMNLSTIAKGLGGIAAALVILAIAVAAMPKNMAITGAGLILVATGVTILAGAIKIMGGMSIGSIAKGMIALAGSLLIISAAMKTMPNMTRTAAGLLIVSVALNLIAKAMVKMGGMSIAQVGKSLLTLAGGLLILTVAMAAMQNVIGGAVALTVAAAGIALLAPALTLLGRQSWGQIIKGLVALAGVFTVIGVAAILLTEAIPSMLGFGAALVVIGAGLALAGVGVALIGVGLSSIVVAVTTGVSIIINSYSQLEQAMVKTSKLIVTGLLEVVRDLAKTAPMFVDAIVKILSSLVDAIIKLSPKIAQAMDALIALIIKVAHDNQGKLVQAGFDLLLAILKGINNNLPKIVTMVTKIIITLLGAVAKNYVKLINAGLNIVINLIKGVSNAYSKVISAAVDLIAGFIKGIANNYSKLISAGLSIVTKIVGAIANNIVKVINAGASLVAGVIKGIGNAASRLVTAGTNAAAKFIGALTRGMLTLVNAGAKAIVKFLNGVADAINKYEPQMIAAGVRIGTAIVTGMLKGMTNLAPSLASKAKSMVSGLPNTFLKAIHAKSPSKDFMVVGEAIISGLTKGMVDNSSMPEKAIADTANGVIDTVKNIFQIASPSKVMQDLGAAVGGGFAQGLRGSTDDINQAFGDLNSKLTDTMSNARQTIASEQAKLRDLRKADKPDAKAIKEAQNIIKENQIILAKSVAGHKELTVTLQDEKDELLKLTRQYTTVADQLDAANQVLADAKQKRDDFFGQTKEQYATLPDIELTDSEGNTVVDQLANYRKSLQQQITATTTYKNTLDQLRKLGLDDQTYQKLLSEGTVDQQFASQILAGGKGAVQSLNQLDSKLNTVSAQLATNASKNLYQAGVDAAQGIVDGLVSKESDLGKAMKKLADSMVAAMKKSLKIKSPSEVFAEIGAYSAEGMAKGLVDSSSVVTDAVDTVSNDALGALRENMSNMSDIINKEIDPNPTITPILDLSQVQSGARALGSILTPAAVSFGQASAISAGQATTEADQAAAQIGPSVKFEQNNYSPAALTEIEIYRQTKNQLSQLKSVVGLPS